MRIPPWNQGALSCLSLTACTLLLGCAQPQGAAPAAAPPPPSAPSTPARLSPEAFRSQLDALPPQIESTMAALNLAAISRDMDRADAIQDFNAGFALLQEDYSSVVGELDELERLGASRYFAAWPMTRFGRTVAAGATVPPEAYDPVAFEMAQMGKRSRTFLAQLGAAADELARSPGASTPRLHQLVQDLNAATPEVLRSVHSLAQSIDRLGG